MVTRVGQVFKWSTFVALVTGGPLPPRCRGSTLSASQVERSLAQLPDDDQVFTLAILHDSGAITWPVERLEASLIKWEADGRRVL